MTQSTKNKLAGKIKAKTGYPKREIERVLTALSEVAFDDILDTGEFMIPDLVTFRVYEKQPRKYWDQVHGHYGITNGGYRLSVIVNNKITKAIKDLE